MYVLPFCGTTFALAPATAALLNVSKRPDTRSYEIKVFSINTGTTAASSSYGRPAPASSGEFLTGETLPITLELSSWITSFCLLCYGEMLYKWRKVTPNTPTDIDWLHSAMTVYLEGDTKHENFTRAFDSWEHL